MGAAGDGPAAEEVKLNEALTQGVKRRNVAQRLGMLAAAAVVTGQYRSGDVRHIVADPARAAELLGFHAAVDPRDGLREFAFAPLRV